MADIFTTHHNLDESTEINFTGSAFLLGIGMVMIPLARVFVGGEEIASAILYNLTSYVVMIFAGLISLRLYPFERMREDYAKLSRYLFTGFLCSLFLFSLVNIIFHEMAGEYLVNYMDRVFEISPNATHMYLMILCSAVFILGFFIRTWNYKHEEVLNHGPASLIAWCFYYVGIISVCGYISLNGLSILTFS